MEKSEKSVRKCSKCGEPGRIIKGLCRKCYDKERRCKLYHNGYQQTRKEMLSKALNTVNRYSDIVTMAINNYTYESIGQKYGITKQAINSIIQKLVFADDNTSKYRERKKLKECNNSK